MSSQFILIDKLKEAQTSFDEKPIENNLVIDINDMGSVDFSNASNNDFLFTLFPEEINLIYQAVKYEQEHNLQ